MSLGSNESVRVVLPVLISWVLLVSSMLFPRVVPLNPKRGRVYTRLVLMLACVVCIYGIHTLYAFDMVDFESFTALIGIVYCIANIIYLILELFIDLVR